MKTIFFISLCLIIWASGDGFYQNALTEISDEVFNKFLEELEDVTSLGEVMDGLAYSNELETTNFWYNDIQEERGKTLRETLDKVLQKIWDAIEHGRQVSRDLTDKAKEISDKLRELGLARGNKAQELLKRIKNKATEWLKKWLDIFGLGNGSLYGNSIRSTDEVDSITQEIEETISLELMNFAGWIGEIMVAGFEHAQNKIINLQDEARMIEKETEEDFEEAALQILDLFLE